MILSRSPRDPPCRASTATSAVQGMYELPSKGYTICFLGNPYLYLTTRNEGGLEYCGGSTYRFMGRYKYFEIRDKTRDPHPTLSESPITMYLFSVHSLYKQNVAMPEFLYREQFLRFGPTETLFEHLDPLRVQATPNRKSYPRAAPGMQSPSTLFLVWEILGTRIILRLWARMVDQNFRKLPHY